LSISWRICWKDIVGGFCFWGTFLFFRWRCLSGVFISFLWFVVSDYPISMRLSTLEIRSSFISVFLFIDSILKNSATINNNEIKDRNEEPL